MRLVAAKGFEKSIGKEFDEEFNLARIQKKYHQKGNIFSFPIVLFNPLQNVDELRQMAQQVSS